MFYFSFRQITLNRSPYCLLKFQRTSYSYQTWLIKYIYTSTPSQPYDLIRILFAAKYSYFYTRRKHSIWFPTSLLQQDMTAHWYISVNPKDTTLWIYCWVKEVQGLSYFYKPVTYCLYSFLEHTRFHENLKSVKIELGISTI